MSHNLDDLIRRSAKAPPENQDFAQRIIFAASQIEQRNSVWSSINRIFEEFHLPAPAYSFASLMLAGFIAGFMNYSLTLSSELPEDNILGQLLYEYEDSL